MTVKAQSYGHSDWRLPSPSSTPQAPHPDSPRLRTPNSIVSPSFFVDAFTTPRPNGPQTPLQTPLHGTFKVVERPASPSRNAYPAPEDPAFHVHQSTATNNLRLPPVSPTRRLSSSPNSSTPSAHPAAAPTTVPNLGATRVQYTSPMNPFQMQTPPPTRDVSSRRKMIPPQAATPVHIAPQPSQTTPVNAGQMQPPPALNIQTPFQFNPLQFSPENFGFAGSGPASAPAYPQSRLFWDPNSQQGMGMETMAMHDPFAANPQTQSPAPVWPSFQHQARVEQQMAQQMAGQIPFGTPQQHPSTQSFNNQTFWSPGDVVPQNRPPFSSPIHPATISQADPSMLSSFSSPPPSSSGTIQPHQTQMSHAQGGRQPYEHQLEESRREQQMARGIQPPSRPNTSSSAASLTAIASRPGLQRSNTDSGTRRRLNQSTDSRLSASSADQQILRKPSPLKRNSQQSQISLTAIPEAVKPRAKTRLVIDENGTARTEVVPAANVVDSRRRSGIWEMDSDSESDAEDITPSQRSSLIFTGDPVRRSKQARIDSAIEPSKVVRSGSSGSLSKMPFGVRRTTSSSSRRGSAKVDPRRSSVASFDATSFTSEGAERNWEMDGVEEGDAQLALKKVIEDKLKRQEQSPEEKLKAHNQRWSLASADIAKLQPFSFDSPSSTPTSHPNMSPTTQPHYNSFVTPGADRTSLPQESIRCTCQHNQDIGTQMIQCESCQKLLHMQCVFNNNQPIPQTFVCSFCTGFTPLARGGRIREPIRNVTAPQLQLNNNTFASPLAGRGNNPFR